MLMAQALDPVEELVEAAFGKDSYVRTDHTQSSAERHAALQAFNSPSRYGPASTCFLTVGYVFVMTVSGRFLLYCRPLVPSKTSGCTS
jgi:hypothetical protein